MKRLTATLPAVILLTLLAPELSAQSPAPADRRAEWYRASYFEYKPDRAEQARQLVREHFWQVDRILRPELVVFEFHTGSWHQVAFFPLHDGPGQLAGSDKDAQWLALLSERAGGREQAQRLLAEWREMIARTKSEIVRRPVLW